jgi:L-fuculose-phosphate aldolase
MRFLHTWKDASSRRIEELRCRREIIRTAHALAEQGTMPGTSGNVSVRIGPNRVLITPTGRSKSMIRPSDLVMVDMEGDAVSGTAQASSELGMHLFIYRHRMDVRAIVHAHPPISTAFACTGRALDQVLCQEAVMTVGTVPLAAYATTGTNEVGTQLREYLDHHEAILMENHGVVCYGKNLSEAFQRTETLEHLAYVHLIAHQLGSPRYLNESQIEEMRRARDNYRQGSQRTRGD